MMTPVTPVMMTEMSREEDRGRGVTVPVQSEELRKDQDLGQGQGRENLPEDHAADPRTGKDLEAPVETEEENQDQGLEGDQDLNQSWILNKSKLMNY